LAGLDQGIFKLLLIVEGMERLMKQRIAPHCLSLASSLTEKTLAAHSEQRSHSVLATLEQCRTVLIEGRNHETAQLLALAILQLRMKLHRIADAELKALCDAMMPDSAPAKQLRSPKPGPRSGPAPASRGPAEAGQIAARPAEHVSATQD
jgi:hypothetical protein